MGTGPATRVTTPCQLHTELSVAEPTPAAAGGAAQLGRRDSHRGEGGSVPNLKPPHRGHPRPGCRAPRPATPFPPLGIGCLGTATSPCKGSYSSPSQSPFPPCALVDLNSAQSGHQPAVTHSKWDPLENTKKGLGLSTSYGELQYLI